MDGAAFWSRQEEGEEEFALAVRLSMLGVSPVGLGTFELDCYDSLYERWQLWRRGILLEVVGPAFCQAYELASRLHMREVVAHDESIGLTLGEPMSERLRDASIPFVEGKNEMRGHREWQKYTGMMAAGEAPGHLPIVFALHAELFTMPLASALQAYCWYEWKMAHRHIDMPDHAGYSYEPPEMFLGVRDDIAQVLTAGESEGQADLRVV